MSESLSPLNSPDPEGVRFSALMPWIDEIEQAVSIEARRVMEARPAHALLIHQAEWHFLGVAYHTRNVLTNYAAMARQAGVPTTRETPDLIIGRALEFRVMMFEFYALLNLARITLDSLRVFLRPLFKTDYGQLPKSVRSFVKGKTDWTSVRFEQKVTVLRVMVTQTLFASCDAACTPVKVQMHRGLILG